jgi:SAM-dependent methyltransferase
MAPESADPPLHELEPTRRFSDRAADYVRYRPTYPAAAFDRLLLGLGDPARLVAADVGAGTGISTRILADRGVRVIAIEPNREMRAAAGEDPRAEWRDGTAEATGLAAQSVDLVLCAQAFHWFRQLEAIAEFHRVLRPRARLALMWNSRDRDDPLTRGYIEAIHEVNGEDPVERAPLDFGVIHAGGLFTPPELLTFPHQQTLDGPGLIGRATSASYVPKEGAGFATLARRLNELFERHRDSTGQVRMKYVTKLYLASRR